MLGLYLLAGGTLLLIFIMFLVISRTMNNIINLMIKMEYSIQKEFDLKQEALEVRRLMEEESQRDDTGATKEKGTP